jgi:hypothetical protein
VPNVDASTVFVAKIAAARASNNADASTAVTQKIPTWRATNAQTATDLNLAIRDAS